MSYSQTCTSAGPNLVTNGNFEACTGTCATAVRLCSEFPNYSPDYSCVDCNGGGPSHAMGGGRYAITSDASVCFNSNWWGAGATGRGGGHAMLIDGSGATTTQLWCQTIAVTSGQKYQFIAWMNNPWTNTADIGSNGPEDIPSIRLTIGGAPISGLVATPTVLGGWDQMNCVYTAPASGNTQICVEMLTNGSTTGNDLLLDDISFTTISSCPSGTCGYTGATLPVNLLSFEAKENGNNALLLWSATAEDGLSGYIVEKSTDGVHFYELGDVNASSPNYHLTQNYQFRDDRFTESSYYRLKIQDKDGKVYYSQVQNLTKNGDKVLISKTEDGIEVKALVNKETDWHIALFSMLGQELVNEIIFLEEGEHILLNSKIHPNKGSEILRITNKEGEVIFAGVIVW